MNEEMKGRKPSYVGDGIAAWINLDKNGNRYLTVQLFGKSGIRVNCFPPKYRVEKASE